MRTTFGISWLVGLVMTAGMADSAAAQEDARAILNKAIQAMGGAEQLGKFKAATWKGQGKFYGLGEGIAFTMQGATQPPHQSRVDSEIDINGMKFSQIRVVNGDKGWIKMMDTTEEMDKDTLTEAREELYAGWAATLLPLRDPAFQLSVVGEAKVGDRPAVGIRVSHKNHRDIILSFDKEKGLLLKSEGRVKDMLTGGQEVGQETLFGDYKAIDGIQRAHKITVKRDGKNFVEIEIEEFKLVDKLDDGLFGKP